LCDQIVEQVRSAIVVGTLAPGTRLPSTRMLADVLSVSPADRGYILSLTSSALSGDKAPQTAVGAWLAKSEILLYFAELARTRQDTPHGGLVCWRRAGSTGPRCRPTR
jgi:hypothetical protein